MTDEITFDTDEKLSSLIQLDVLLAHQHFATFRRKELEPEKQLMLTVLADAATCFQRYICVHAGLVLFRIIPVGLLRSKL